jgi:flagellar motor component MotA
MSQHSEPGRPPAAKRERSVEDVMWRRVERKRERIRAEIERNRKGGHKIPTWVLAAVLGLILAGWIYLIITS